MLGLAQRIANLQLKHKKCNLILTTTACTEQIVSIIEALLLEHIPEWASFSVVPQAVYLGFNMGPAVLDVQ